MFLENNIHSREEVGWIEVIYGSMFSGRTEELIHRPRRTQLVRQKAETLKPSLGMHYDDTSIVSHSTTEALSTLVEATASILLPVDGCDVVGIDEAQLFDDEIVNTCSDLVNRGVRVIVTGLDMDYKGSPFGSMPHLMVTAECVTKVHAVCTRTGHLVNYSFGKMLDDSQRMLDESKSYKSLGRAAFIKARTKDEAQKTVNL